MTIAEKDFERTEDELLLEIAESLAASGEIRFSGPIDDSGKRDRARRWLDALLSKLKGSICGDIRVIAYLQNPTIQNQMDIAGVIVDVLTAMKISVPVGTLAVLIVKGRLQNLCV